ncbi:DUF3630 family protein [Photobacterium galatheae]|uniref:Aminopeptidase n=1 Tax=Photobacterium galatheae TaxID=1654360 RepID=A0A066RXM3_9GAMM|nr:DUF3630 family protein [Photobacterium galatheae]KDM92133.1 hypothetical protein EA58_07875 [Photobacterium galatheae]MCM0150979.1 DUF3630 family protein [Photobacterium galatheae]
MTISSEPHFGVRELDHTRGCLHLIAPEFDYDSFAGLAQSLVTLLGASVVEQEANADLHVWLIDFEGCRLLLKGEHYSASLWLEILSQDDRETLDFLAAWLKKLTY